MAGYGSGRVVPETDFDFDPSRNKWDRQPFETDQSWEALRIYRDLGDKRTIGKVAKLLGKATSGISRWSGPYRWRERVEAWDAHCDQVSTEAALAARRKAAKDMVHRHLGLSTHLQSIVSVELMRWAHKLGVDKTKPNLTCEPSLQTHTIQHLLEYAVKLERLNRDEPESITETRDKSASVDELEEKIQHLLKARE